MSKQTRYKLDTTGRIREWHCWLGEDVDGIPGIYTTDGLYNESPEDTFKLKDPTYKMSSEKNIGKSNYLSTADQAVKMLEQAVGKKERSGYFSTVEEARNSKIWLPMLCPAGMKWKDYKGKPLYPALASNKLDGARCNVMMIEGKIRAFTRTGKEWMNFEHLIASDAIIRLFEDFPEIILDGEVYNHAYKDNFEDLMSIFKKQSPTDEQKAFSKENSKYFVYDVYSKNYEDLSALNRQQVLKSIFTGYLGTQDTYVLESSVIVSTEEDFDGFQQSAIDAGYEGSILRLINAPYDVDKRSKSLLKRKEVFDCEFTVIGIIEGESTKAGMAGMVEISLENPTGMNPHDLSLLDKTSTQKAGMAKGWNDERCIELFNNQTDFIGMIATIEYFGITSKGKLRFPKIKAFRDYEG